MASISEREMTSRRQSNEDVLGTHAMEGLFPDAATKALLDRFAAGSLSREQLSAAIDAHVKDLLAARMKMAGAA